MKYKLLFLGIAVSLMVSPTVLAARPTTAPAGGSQNQQGGGNGNTQTVQERVRKCQALEAGIRTRSMNMNQFAYKIMENFSMTANRIDDYYQRKLKSSANTTVANYNGLMAEVQKKKMTAMSANTQAQNMMMNFNCNGENPGEGLQAYNANMEKVKIALKEYKGAVKNLSEAVRTAAKKGGQQ